MKGTGPPCDKGTYARQAYYITFYYIRAAIPISKHDFETESTGTPEFGEGTQPRRILRFLADNPEAAYTQTEIHEETGIRRERSGPSSRVSNRAVSCATADDTG